jgi:hypothetical protein
MRREDFEHVVAAAAEASGETELVVVGSQAILGSFPDAPPSKLRSMEADLYPLRHPEKADEIDGSLGDGSWFHRTHGYYAHRRRCGDRERAGGMGGSTGPRRGSSPGRFATARCRALAREALAHGLVDAEVLLRRIDDLPVAEGDRRRIREMLEGITPTRHS